ncbi:MAG: hypothetical protein NTY99_02635 [DPANN group archaeon]|nr:hypothetical protein [DPANN group archaeon]
MKLSPHEVSLRTRSAIYSVIQRYNLEPELTKKYGLLDRIIRGYLHATDGNARLVWPHELPEKDVKEYHVVAEVVSGRDIAPKGTTEYKERMKWRRPYRIGAKFVYDSTERGKRIFSLEEIGGDYEFTLRRGRERINGHTCEDSLFQSGFKGIPTACYHTCAVRFVASAQLNKDLEEAQLDDVLFAGDYSQIDDILIDLYKEMEHHNLKSWQRLNVLYACATGEIKSFSFGKDFLKSVEDFLKEPAKQLR